MLVAISILAYRLAQFNYRICRLAAFRSQTCPHNYQIIFHPAFSSQLVPSCGPLSDWYTGAPASMPKR